MPPLSFPKLFKGKFCATMYQSLSILQRGKTRTSIKVKMIRSKRLTSDWRYPTERRELAYIYAISRKDMTINEMKYWRLRDITHYICPFCPKDVKHQQRSSYGIINHIIKCYTASYHGINGKEAMEKASCWTFCDKDESHMFHVYFEQMHYELYKNCKLAHIGKDE